MTFGYNADSALEQSTAEIMDHAKSLLASLVDKREEREEYGEALVFTICAVGAWCLLRHTLANQGAHSRAPGLKNGLSGVDDLRSTIRRV
ncbi:hypothetical protein PV11_03450 [Exophiala sideris]|uniref:Uncharacterized protein n=1 Tax=Exophiala sideris TaxID=1016849 RepID=A0A0D1VY09_9EURO|nr:hypothetical protein PV11_03450 [Exophiala sideris]